MPPALCEQREVTQPVSADNKTWHINTVYAPGSATTAETFIWFRATPDLRLGLAHLWKQNSFRYLASYRLVSETQSTPGFFLSAGVQGIGTGNPGYAGFAEKNFNTELGRFNLYAGVGFRSNENHAHPVAGAKLTLTNRITFGVQHDGHSTNPFVTYSVGSVTAGLYFIDGRQPAYLIGFGF